MAQLLILGKNYDYAPNPSYRGTEHRHHPQYHEELDVEHEVNRWFLWLTDNYGDVGVVEDVQKAREIVAAYTRLAEPEQFEIVEAVIEPDGSPTYGKKFLGYDISYGLGNSLLAWDLLTYADKQGNKSNPKSNKLIPLLKLVEVHFRPNLNENRLFDNYADADFCLQCMMAIESCCPGIYEYGDYEVVGLYEVHL